MLSGGEFYLSMGQTFFDGVNVAASCFNGKIKATTNRCLAVKLMEVEELFVKPVLG